MTQHGHTILEMILENDRRYSVESLREAALQQFGSDVTFHTCSAEGMSFDGLMAFLFERGKIAEEEGLLTMFPDKLCQHDH